MLEQLYNRIRRDARPFRKLLTRVSADETRVRLFHEDTVVNDEIVKAPRPAHRHVFHSLEATKTWLADLGRQKVGDLPARVFVGEQNVNVEAAYHSNEVVSGLVPLIHADEYRALQDSFRWQTQKDLWRLLSTRLSRNIGAPLRLQLSKIKVSDSRTGEVRINELGIAEGQGKNSIEITTPGGVGLPEHTTKFQVEWQYTGRVYECYKQEIRLDLILEADYLEGRLKFRFAPVNQETVLREYRDEFVDFVEETLTPEFAVVMQAELVSNKFPDSDFHEEKNEAYEEDEFGENE